MSHINVDTKYRKNPLSFVEGGCTIRLEFEGDNSKSYDKVKFPKNYISVAIARHPTIVRVYQNDELIWVR